MRSLARPSAAAALCLALARAAGPLASQAQPASIQPVAGDSVSLDFRDTDIRLVISALAEMARLNVTYSGLAGLPVTLRSTIARADARRTLESLARGSGLTLTEENGLLRVSNAPPVAVSPFASPYSAGPPSAPTGGGGAGSLLFIYQVRHADANALANTLRELFGLGAREVSSSPSGPEPLSRELASQRIPLPGEQSAPRSAPGFVALTGRVGGNVQIVPDTRTNQLLIRGSAADFETIVAATQRLDVRPLQVLIEVLIVEVRRSRERALGASIGVPRQMEPRTGATLGGEFDDGRSTGDLVVEALGLGAVKADVVIRALAASGDVSILSRPIVLAQNNEEARFLVGDQRPFIQVSRSLPDDSGVRDQVVQYRDVGTELTIRPTINPDGYVVLDVAQEVSNATQSTQFGAPIINTREAKSRIMVQDRHTAIIGGLIRQVDERTATGIPVLRDIPFLGRLFRSESRSTDETELFLLLTPRVLRTDADMDDATRGVEDGTRGVRKRLEEYR
ncbi:MAG TPA: secretin N-terminal domain-containing protein, partial [Longimicrobium sp.]